MGLALSGLPAVQFGLEGLLAVGDVRLVAGWVDEGIAVASLEAGILGGEIEVAAMGAEENVAGQRFKHRKTALVVRSYLRISLVANQLVPGIHVGAADDDDVENAAAFCLVHRPGSGAPGVPGSEMRGED